MNKLVLDIPGYPGYTIDTEFVVRGPKGQIKKSRIHGFRYVVKLHKDGRGHNHPVDHLFIRAVLCNANRRITRIRKDYVFSFDNYNIEFLGGNK